ncbi:GDYXXLXY domain-containing protein [Bacillus songklensis]|uniref:GDYXXLXY domain-containing protein n=1 Tax=Bacillus songklensis TaxID=1069116 RepID=A0ABV8B3Z4_9BACI
MGEGIGNKPAKERAIELGYVTGLSLILAAIIYFFASNWPGLDKWEKIGLSIGLIALFYGSAFVFSKIFQERPFLSELLLFGGCIAFGAGVALLGQIYNSHADSFMLFTVWAVPALLFAFITKYQPFYILSYVLVHLAVWLFLFPSSGIRMEDDYWYRAFFLGVAFVNIVLFWLIQKGAFRSKPLTFLSFTVFHITMLMLTGGELFEFFSSMMSIVYMAILVFWFWHDMKQEREKGYTVLLGVALAAFFIIKFVAFLAFVGSEYVFLWTIFFPVVIVGAAVFVLSKWKGMASSWIKKTFIGVIVAVASVTGASSIAGILFLIIGEIPFYIMALLAIFAFILPAVLKPKWNAVIRHTLLLTGYLIGIPSAILSNIAFSFLFIGMLGFVFWNHESKSIKHLTYFATMIALFASLLDEGITMEVTVLILVLLNIALFAGRNIFKDSLKRMVYQNSYVCGFLAFFVLTFLNEHLSVFYFTVNGLYFVTSTIVLFLSLKHERVFEYRVALLFWFVYIAYKYYDLLWSLLHKSITFLVIGLLILAVVTRYDRFSKADNAPLGLVRKKWVPIVLVILVQLSAISVQAGKSESLLAHGELIKLELQPVDPRSLLQGDYIVLRYSISNVTISPEPRPNEKISIKLAKNEHGVYEYSGSFVMGKPENPEQGDVDVWITGRYKGSGNIEYGIENYFVSEGTGLDLQQKVNYAKVKVSKNGDAILVSVE